MRPPDPAHDCIPGKRSTLFISRVLRSEPTRPGSCALASAATPATTAADIDVPLIAVQPATTPVTVVENSCSPGAKTSTEPPTLLVQVGVSDLSLLATHIRFGGSVREPGARVSHGYTGSSPLSEPSLPAATTNSVSS